MGGRHLHGLVGADPLQRLLQAELPWRGEAHQLVGARGADVGELLLLGRVDVHVVVTGVLADDHALVDVHARSDEQLPAVLEVEQCELRRGAGAVGDERAVRPRRDVAEPRLPAVEGAVDDAGAAGLGEELGPEPDQAAGRDLERDPRPAAVAAGGLHRQHPALAQAEQLGHHADVVVGHVDGEVLDGLVDGPVDLAGHDLGLADGQLEALAAHGLHEDRQLQLAAALDLPDVGAVGVAHPQRDVADQLLLQPLLQQPCGDLAALASGQR